MHNFIIVGQGIAGSLLSWFLSKAGKTVLVIDDAQPSSSSRIAAGIINPVTGRKFVKTWLADELIPFAEETYAELSGVLGEQLYEHLPILHLFDSVKSQNDWSVRCATPEYGRYLKNEQVVYLDGDKVKNEFGAFEISGAGRLNTERFVVLYNQWLEGKGLLLKEKFDFNKFSVQAEGVIYGEHQAEKIIFCEGANAVNNPYFKFLPFQLAKGEHFILRIPDFYPDRIIKAEAAIMPYDGSNLYYAGATHNWYFDDDKPSDIGRDELLGNITAMLNCPFEMVEHRAAIRPTVKNRRPFIGFHPEHNRIGIFNGMGTKGVSLSPYFARHFTQHLLQQKTLMPEVDIQQLIL